MTRASVCIPRILKHEGGFVDHPKDPGGATNKGITLATFREFIKPGGTVEDLKHLTTDQAVIVYKRQYWDRVVADLLPVGLDYAVADFAVNSGPARAAKYLQALVGVAQDGMIGPQTLAAVADFETAHLIDRLCDRRLKFMKSIKGGSLWKTFGRGWARRVTDVREHAHQDRLAAIRPAPPEPAPQPAPQGGIWAALLRLLAAFTTNRKEKP